MFMFEKAAGSRVVGSEAAEVRVRIRLPAPELQPFVTFYYFVDVQGPLTDFLYPEWGNVRLSLSGDWRVLNDPRDPDVPAQRVLFGPTDRRGKIVTGGGSTAGFGLTPLGWDRLIGGNAGAMANRVREMNGELGVDPRDLQAAFVADRGDAEAGAARFDRVLLALVAQRPVNKVAVLNTDRVLRLRPRDAAAFAELAGVAPRTLHRVCLGAFGFPPKRLLRRQRFLQTLGLIRVSPNSRFGPLIDDGYFDQAHFNRDFRDFMGMTARQYARTPRALMRAAAAAQVANGITLSFDLPAPPSETPSM